MTRAELESLGWRLIRECIAPNGNTYQLWDHPDHQNRNFGFFTKSGATAHQEYLDQGNHCTCLPHDGGKLRDKPLL